MTRDSRLQSALFSIFSSKLSSLFLVSLAMSSAIAQSSSKARWYDGAKSEKQCPVAAVNVPSNQREARPAELAKRISVTNKTLSIQGSDDPDHIVVSSVGLRGWVVVRWNGKLMGPFGPVEHILLQGNGGDDALIVKAGVGLPVVLDGGDGDDCLQGGSGGDVILGGNGDDLLIAGTGRSSLNSGSGNNQLVLPQHLGKLRYAPSADPAVLKKLGQIFDLEPMQKKKRQALFWEPEQKDDDTSPIVVGAADLADVDLVSNLKATHTAAQAIVLTAGSAADSEKLRLTLGHPNSGVSSPGSAGNGNAPLSFFRSARRPGTRANDYRTGVFLNLPDKLDEWTIELLSQVFSTTAEIPGTPNALAVPGATGDESNDLLQLANSYTSSIVNNDNQGDGVQVVDSVWGVRSFRSQADFYYVQQEVDYRNGPSVSKTNDDSSANMQAPINVGLLQPSPASTSCTESTTSGTTFTTTGSVGWNEMQGFNASVSEGVSISTSKTISCPNTKIVDMSNPGNGTAQWSYEVSNPPAQNLNSFLNQWLWQVPFNEYTTGQQDIVMVGGANQSPSGLGTSVQQSVPLPLGDTFILEKPIVTSVSPTCVNAGNTFAINGSGLYPSMITSVLVGGNPLSSAQYTPVSDSLLDVVAPQISGESLPVVVQTGEGVSNSNVTIEISTFGFCSL